MKRVLQRLKPGASKRTQLFLAAVLWSVVGAGLMIRGGVWLKQDGGYALYIPAMIVGVVKSFMILDTAAEKILTRILQREEYSCLGGVYSWKTWVLVLFMIGMGFFLRSLILPVEVVGFVYLAVGSGLSFSARKGWSLWFLMQR